MEKANEKDKAKEDQEKGPPQPEHPQGPDQNHKIGSQPQSFANGVEKQDIMTIAASQNTPICDPHEIPSHHQSSQVIALKCADHPPSYF